VVILRSAAVVVGLGEGFIVCDEGVTEGSRLEGKTVGTSLGFRKGDTLVNEDGSIEGTTVGTTVGTTLGFTLGSEVGFKDGM
jgi:hypothetical protein